MRTHADVHEILALKAIHESVRDRGYPPSQREISQACGWSSPSGANNLIKLMEARGLIEVTPGIPRALRITEAGAERITGANMVADTAAV